MAGKSSYVQIGLSKSSPIFKSKSNPNPPHLAKVVNPDLNPDLDLPGTVAGPREPAVFIHCGNETQFQGPDCPGFQLLDISTPLTVSSDWAFH